MARETVRDKAGRYLLEGRVIVDRVDAHMVTARVRGDGAIHVARWTAGNWTCSCPHQAQSSYCSHIYALRRITAVDLNKENTP